MVREPPQRNAEQEQASGQHHEEEEPLRQPGDGRELGEALEAGGSAARDRIRGRREHRQGRQVHDVVGVAERDFRERVREVHHRPGPLAHREARNPEHEAEHHDLQHVAPCQGVHDARRNRVLQRIHEPGRLRKLHPRRPAERQPVAGPGRRHAEPAEQQGEGGGDLEADHRLPAQPPERAHRAGARDRPDEDPHQHRRDDRPDQPEEERAQELDALGPVRRPEAEGDAPGHPDEDPPGERDSGESGHSSVPAETRISGSPPPPRRAPKATAPTGSGRRPPRSGGGSPRRRSPARSRPPPGTRPRFLRGRRR